MTGRPASGKSTLSHLLSQEIKCPLLSRDQLKEGYLNTFHCSHDTIGPAATRDIYETFFQAIELLLSGNISVIAEAAFQHKLWYPKLIQYMGIADIRILVCEIDPQLALSRYTSRLASDADRERFHGDRSELAKQASESLISSYIAPDIPVPTLKINTTDNYQPDIAGILDFIRSSHA
ncbi:MAG: AAA family ATPase [Bacteroidetes bacterium]|nr:AAA family ATPase [Bacteroidota bacterium]